MRVCSAGSFEQVNRMLRDQLDQATSANAALTSDVQRLSLELQRTRDELDGREAEWRREEQVFNDYYTTEHARLLALWRQVVAFRRQFSGASRSSTSSPTAVSSVAFYSAPICLLVIETPCVRPASRRDTRSARDSLLEHCSARALWRVDPIRIESEPPDAYRTATRLQ